jgi:hypothetical protein
MIARGLSALPSLLVLAAAPAQAGGERPMTAAVCGEGSVRLIAIPRRPDAPPRRDPHQTLCAHLACHRTQDDPDRRKPRA